MEYIEQFGPLALFLTGLLEFLGVPLPGGAVLLAGGALAGAGGFSVALAFVASALGAFLADQVWYRLARARGERLLSAACRISLNPQACVCQAKGAFERFGPRALLIAKLIPGVSNLATPVAGVIGMPARTFTLYSALGAAVWAGVWLGLGLVLEISLMPAAEQIGMWAPAVAAVLGAVALGLLAFKVAMVWWAMRNDPHPEGAHPQNPFSA